LLWIIVAFLVAAFIWAALTQLDRTVVGQGKVTPSSKLQVVSNLEGGLVEAILVHTGEEVRRGQALVRLSPVQTRSEFGSGRAAVMALQVKIARLRAEVLGREPVYPQTTDPILADQISIERALHSARLSDLKSMESAMAARTIGARRDAAAAEATYAARQSAVSGAMRQAEIFRPLVDHGVEPRITLVEAENRVDVGRSEARAAGANASRARATVAEAIAAASQQRQDWRSKAADELEAASSEFSVRSQGLTALADRSERATIRAQMAGRINRVLVNTVGGVVRPGEPIVEIVPSEKGLLIEVLISPKDIAFVRTGQVAKVDVTAYEAAVYGSLHGKVISISPDASVNERTGESFYFVRVLTDSDALLDQRGKRLPIGPGMIANVSLLGDKRSVLNYILTPITRLGEQAFRE
jgi:adhesin transport system membrane fusion protein